MVARALVARRGRDETAEAAAAFGLDAGRIAESEPALEIWPENVAAVQMWLAVQTQWRIDPAGQPTGLNYAGVAAAIEMAGIRDRARMWEAICLMERETLLALSREGRSR
ncbi:MAG: hypothetical protein KatS3mg119_1883 [Rhodothalassiaceae bacterium]|nr:MAG: hypothetical protein KatS3mg119_1883 [Rhodothalassiaceae bacterium]